MKVIGYEKEGKQDKLNLKYSKTIFRIIKQRKNKYMKLHNCKELNWEDFIMISVLTM